MTYKEIDEHTLSDEKLELLLANYKESFELVDYYSTLFKGGALVQTTEIHDALDKLTGTFMSLNTPYQMLIAKKENEEAIFYEKRRMEIESTEKKFVSASVEREASVAVSTLRRVRNIFGAYVSSCEKGISTCQSKLKYLEKEK